MKRSLLVLMSIGAFTIGSATDVGAENPRLSVKMVDFYAQKAIKEGKAAAEVVSAHQQNILNYFIKAVDEEIKRIKRAL